MEIVTLAVVCLSNIICFTVGAGIGQKLRRGEDVRLPDPVKRVQERKEAREQRREQEAIDTMLYNIDVYDGTDMGQKEIKG